MWRAAEYEEAHLEAAHGVRGQVDLDAEQEVRYEQSRSYPGGHAAGQPEAAEQEDSADGVEHVVDVVAVPGPLLVSDACAIQTSTRFSSPESAPAWIRLARRRGVPAAK